MLFASSLQHSCESMANAFRVVFMCCGLFYDRIRYAREAEAVQMINLIGGTKFRLTNVFSLFNCIQLQANSSKSSYPRPSRLV